MLKQAWEPTAQNENNYMRAGRPGHHDVLPRENFEKLLTDMGAVVQFEIIVFRLWPQACSLQLQSIWMDAQYQAVHLV